MHLETVRLGTCSNCGHEISFYHDQWKHHITRSRLYSLPHWPAGHVMTQDCKRNCKCTIPSPDSSKEQRTMVFLMNSHPER